MLHPEHLAFIPSLRERTRRLCFLLERCLVFGFADLGCSENSAQKRIAQTLLRDGSGGGRGRPSGLPRRGVQMGSRPLGLARSHPLTSALYGGTHDLFSASSSRAVGLAASQRTGPPELSVRSCPSPDASQLFPACLFPKRFTHFGFLMLETFLELGSASSVGYVLLFLPQTNE